MQFENKKLNDKMAITNRKNLNNMAEMVDELVEKLKNRGVPATPDVIYESLGMQCEKFSFNVVEGDLSSANKAMNHIRGFFVKKGGKVIGVHQNSIPNPEKGTRELIFYVGYSDKLLKRNKGQNNAVERTMGEVYGVDKMMNTLSNQSKTKKN
ncbi:hypothetical protein JEQ21_02940 [Streptococcus sp. 121]|uniref:hypothetical protein n=1 Tax=Streptococcus sp. 121 TaxID=2797637 RepID=UPI0018F092CC|nr:hypothetical protein [Streptococcus sp. 121]MBJ6745429.1 hypothetical protein [Streptococcus sp. 121]